MNNEFNVSAEAVKQRIIQSVVNAEASLKKYTDAFPEDFSLRSEDAEKRKVFTAKYYACAVELTENFDATSSLSDEIYLLINTAKVSNDEGAQALALELFGTVMDLTKAHEGFLDGSEKIVSNKKANISYSALRQIAVAFSVSLSSIKSRLV